MPAAPPGEIVVNSRAALYEVLDHTDADTIASTNRQAYTHAKYYPYAQSFVLQMDGDTCEVGWIKRKDHTPSPLAILMRVAFPGCKKDRRRTFTFCDGSSFAAPSGPLGHLKVNCRRQEKPPWGAPIVWEVFGALFFYLELFCSYVLQTDDFRVHKTVVLAYSI